MGIEIKYLLHYRIARRVAFVRFSYFTVENFFTLMATKFSLFFKSMKYIVVTKTTAIKFSPRNL